MWVARLMACVNCSGVEAGLMGSPRSRALPQRPSTEARSRDSGDRRKRKASPRQRTKGGNANSGSSSASARIDRTGPAALGVMTLWPPSSPGSAPAPAGSPVCASAGFRPSSKAPVRGAAKGLSNSGEAVEGPGVGNSLPGVGSKATPGRESPTPGPSTASPEFESPFAAPLTGAFDEGRNPADAQTGLPAGAGADPGEEGGQSVITPNAAGPVRSILALALLLPLLALPPLVRWRGEALRFRRSPESRLRASVEGLCGNARDLGLPISPASTPEQLTQAIKRATHIDAGFFSVEAQQILYGGRPVTAQDVRSAET